MSPDAHELLKKIAPEHWSKLHVKLDFKCDMPLNNLCEYFNNLILGVRFIWIVTLNETVRTKLMCRIQKKGMSWKNGKISYVLGFLKN